jgi:hypothetical protein
MTCPEKKHLIFLLYKEEILAIRYQLKIYRQKIIVKGFLQGRYNIFFKGWKTIYVVHNYKAVKNPNSEQRAQALFYQMIM